MKTMRTETIDIQASARDCGLVEFGSRTGGQFAVQCDIGNVQLQTLQCRGSDRM